MEMVLLTALGVGGATVIGSVIGFIFKKISHKFSDIVLSFAAGVMLAAAVLGLIIPSVEYGGKFGILVTVAGIFADITEKIIKDHFYIVVYDRDRDALHNTVNGMVSQLESSATPIYTKIITGDKLYVFMKSTFCTDFDEREVEIRNGECTRFL